jgi:hypothetical protein
MPLADLVSNLEHPLALGSFRNWLRLLAESEGIEARFAPRLLSVSALTLLTSPLRMYERMRYERALGDVLVHPSPIFIIGHWRTGTTFLHHLLCQDRRLGYVSTYQAMAPEFCLIGDGTFRSLLAWVVERLHPTRLIDSIPLRLDAPQEEDYAVAATSPHSFLHSFTLPRQANDYFERYALLRDLPSDVMAAWREAYLNVLRKATFSCGGKRLALKSPVNTGRIRALLELFPEAKFVHVTRNPYDVFLSTVFTYRAVLPRAQLQSVTGAEVDANVLRFYAKLMQQFLSDRGSIKPGSLIEVRFEDLEVDALVQVRRIYEELQLGGFSGIQPRVRAYLASVEGYRKNQYELTRDAIEKVNQHWGFAFDEWGYGRLTP